MKKIIKLIFCILVVASLQALVFAESNEVELLKQLNVLDNKEETTELTRGDFAIYAAKLFGNVGEGGAEERYFIDVDPNSRAAKSIHILYEKGIVNGKGDGTFGTNDKITPYEAAVIMTRIGGYEAYAKTMGYENIIAENNLLKGIGGNTLTFRDAAKIIFNALSSPVLVVDQYMGGMPTYNIDEDYLLMEKLFSMYEVKGILNSADGVRFKENVNAAKDIVTIGDTDYAVDDSLAHKMYYDLGCFVEAYVKEDDYGVETLVHYSVDDKTEKTTIMFSELLKPVDDSRVINYYKDGKNRKINFSDDTVLLRNGKIEYDIDDAFAGTQGVITVLEDSEVFLITVTTYDSVLVSSTNVDKNMIYAKYGKSIEFDANKFDRARIYLADGINGTISDIKAGMFLTVSRGENTIEINVSSSVLSGTAQEISDDGITIDGNFYEVEPEYKDEVLKILAIGDVGTFYFNKYNELAYFVKGVETGVNYGVLVRAFEDEDVYFNARIFTSDGEMKNFRTSDKVNIDGKRYIPTDAITALSNAGGGVISQVVAYTLNAEGEIFEIDTVADNGSGSGLKKSADKMSREWYASGRIMMPDIAL